MVLKERTGCGRLTGVLLAFVQAMLSVGCEEPTERAAIVVPDGFTGRIRIVFGDRGDPPERVDGRTVYRIPKSGTFFVRSDNRFLRWTEIQVKTASGTVIPVATPQYDRPDETRYRVSGSTNDGGEYWAAVGTIHELHDASASLNKRKSDALRTGTGS